MMSRVPGRAYRPPAEWVVSGGTWPGGPFHRDAPLYVSVTAALVVRLGLAVAEDGRSLRAIAADAEIGHGSLSRLLAGRSVPDLGTIASLEHALDANLWPAHHEEGGTR